MKLIFGVGLNDSPDSTKIGSKSKNSYIRWRHMLQRGYDPKYKELYPTYEGVSVTEEWHRFSVFEKWYDEHYVEGWVLDKDLLVPGNKLYSPETCLFIPQHLNKFTTDRINHRGDCPIGVTYHKQTGLYHARINSHGERLHLGLFNTPEEAYGEWLKAKINLIHGMKEELDLIDSRLYFSLLNKYQQLWTSV